MVHYIAVPRLYKEQAQKLEHNFSFDHTCVEHFTDVNQY